MFDINLWCFIPTLTYFEKWLTIRTGFLTMSMEEREASVCKDSKEMHYNGCAFANYMQQVDRLGCGFVIDLNGVLC